MTELSNIPYNELYEKILKVTGVCISRFEQISLLIHSILLKKGYCLYDKGSILNEDWNKEPNKVVFKYIYNSLEYELQIVDNEQLEITLIGRKSVYSDPTLKRNKTLKISDFNVDFTNLNETISDLESFIYKNLLEAPSKIQQNYDQNILQGRKNDYIPQNPRNNYFPSGNIPSGNPENIFNPNPFFSSGGVGGNLVGPNSAIFNPNQPNFGSRYDPIGPFGLFGGPNKKDPFGPNKKDPFGGNGGFI